MILIKAAGNELKRHIGTRHLNEERIKLYLNHIVLYRRLERFHDFFLFLFLDANDEN